MSPKFNFYMSGVGYGHPEWGHGRFQGSPLKVGYDSFKTADVNENDPQFQHVQAFVEAKLTGPNVSTSGTGVLEQLAIGAYEPHGLKGIFDPAP